ncbi:unnamed protein product [Ilex paraguariensis]|uniref:Uncharacterized protein n=1 Tax=Ilex paraguariensis TaxID=185542 RepID=A0ABC8TEX3_9AQUA
MRIHFYRITTAELVSYRGPYGLRLTLGSVTEEAKSHRSIKDRSRSNEFIPALESVVGKADKNSIHFQLGLALASFGLRRLHQGEMHRCIPSSQEESLCRRSSNQKTPFSRISHPFRVIQLAKPLPFDSIVQLPKDIDSIPIVQGISWEPTWKTVPNVRIPKDALYPKYHSKPIKSAFLALTYELAAYGSMLRLDHAQEAFFSSAVLWRERVRFALDPTNTETANKDLDCFERWVGPKLPTFEQFEYQGE